ncbi:hypothetical protein ACSV9I_21320 [Rhizobium sp. G187]|uniref:hypothetical protein n=1 Tax=Rhizobium sp. G187 TaxID=3451352 RepID=UPI003EE57E9E
MTRKSELSPLSRAIVARRQTQQHFDRLSRQITASAPAPDTYGENDGTVASRHRSRLVPSNKVLWLECVECLTFERWNEFDALAVRLVRHDQLIDLLRQSEIGCEGQRGANGGHPLARPVHVEGADA